MFWYAVGGDYTKVISIRATALKESVPLEILAIHSNISSSRSSDPKPYEIKRTNVYIILSVVLVIFHHVMISLGIHKKEFNHGATTHPYTRPNPLSVSAQLVCCINRKSFISTQNIKSIRYIYEATSDIFNNTNDECVDFRFGFLFLWHLLLMCAAVIYISADLIPTSS